MSRSNNRFAVFVAILLCCLIIYCIVTQVKETHSQNDPKLKEILKVIEPVFRKENYPSGRYSGSLESLNSRNILDETQFFKGDKSYTINKKKVYMCLKDDKGSYYPNNSLIYVFLHEMAHVICDEIGHTEKFHDIFEELLENAKYMKLYDPTIPMVQNYCSY